MITIIDYGLGNIKAFGNVYKQLNVPYTTAKNVEELSGATKIILPGVGAFDHAMNQLQNSGMREKLDQLILEEKIPIIGICVGMQMLANSSDEGKLAGLGWIDASVKKFDENSIKYATHLPHMGWNDVEIVKNNPILESLEKSKFYFLHSYYFHCNNPEDSIAVSDYGIKFSCAVNKENIYGVQFHPEKSHKYGIQILQNFANL